YGTLNPLSQNAFTGQWTPPLQSTDIIQGVSRNQGTPNSAVLVAQNAGNHSIFVFGTNVAANTAGQFITLTDPTFASAPQIAFDSKKNRAVVAASDGAVGGPPPKIALVNLSNGNVSVFTGVPGPPPFRQGFINGLAVDSDDNVALTTTEVDFS